MGINRKYVIISGYGWSGSSALIDYLKEFEKVFVPDVEFRLIKDPYGISQLESILTEKWDYINASAAIDDFLWLCKKCARSCRHFFSPFGLNYERFLNPDFLRIADDYISSLVDFKYRGSNYHKEFKKNYLRSVYRRFSRGLISRTSINIPYYEDECYFLKPTADIFIEHTKKFINTIFEPSSSDEMIIVLDQAVSPLHPEDMRFFGDCKMITVDRNPCDIYIDLIKHKSLIGSDLAITRNPYEYINWHKSIRNNNVDMSNVYKLNFEDFVLNHNESKQKIHEFIGWDLGKHIYEKKYFNPAISSRNINQGVCEYCMKEEYDVLRTMQN